jgi:hypothetical protein
MIPFWWWWEYACRDRLAYNFFFEQTKMIYINNTSEAPCTRRAKSDSPNKIYRVMPSKERHKTDINNY